MLAEKYIPKSRYKDVLGKLKEIRADLGNLYGNKQLIFQNIKRVETLLNLPLNKISPANLDKTAVLDGISKKMQTYDSALVESLREMAFEFMHDSQDPEDITKSSYYFLGVPGTGKPPLPKWLPTK